MTPSFKYHVFVCTNRRDADNPKGSCAAKNAEAIRDHLKIEAHKRGLKREVRVNNAGCLDACAEGPSIVVYPEGTWYTVPTIEDAQEIVDRHLAKGEIVERLRMK